MRFLGRVPDDRGLPALYGCADAFAMLCRNRWLGLEQEGFGIVFLEAAAACGVPQVAGRSGGSAAEAVIDGVTGTLVVGRPRSTSATPAGARHACSITRPSVGGPTGGGRSASGRGRAHLRGAGPATGRGVRQRVRLAAMAATQAEVGSHARPRRSGKTGGQAQQDRHPGSWCVGSCGRRRRPRVRSARGRRRLAAPSRRSNEPPARGPGRGWRRRRRVIADRLGSSRSCPTVPGRAGWSSPRGSAPRSSPSPRWRRRSTPMRSPSRRWW